MSIRRPPRPDDPDANRHQGEGESRDKVAIVIFGISASFLVVFFLISEIVKSPPPPRFASPGHRSVHYLLGSIYNGSSSCEILENDVGSLIAPGLMECSGWGYSLVVRNARNGCVLDLHEKFDLELVSDDGDKKVFLDTKNNYLFEVSGLMILDFYEARSSESKFLDE